MNVVDRNAVLKRLRFILMVNDEASTYLEKLETDELELLNDQIQNMMYEDQVDKWQKVAKLVKFFPNYVNAKMSEQVLGAQITAQISYHVSTPDLVGIAKRLSTPFMAEVTEHIIPSKASRIVNDTPIEIVEGVVAQLMREKKHFVVSSFIEVVDSNRLKKIIDSIRKPSDLVLSAQYIQNPNILKNIFLGFSKSKQIDVIKASVEIGKESVIITTLSLIDESERAQIVNNTPIETVEAVVEQLMDKKEYAIVSSFIEVIEDNRLHEVVEMIENPADLILAAEHIQNSKILKNIFISLSKSKQIDIIKASVAINKESVIMNTLAQLEESERAQVLTDFVQNNPEGAAAFLAKFGTK
ncbi:MAG: hypothetical protein M9887_05180 [Chitinophagales bacterium]|nr:hypothetical protein [Chitinophagales bacterium]